MQNNRTSNDTRLALLEQSINHINETLIRFEKRFDNLDQKIDTFHSLSWSQFKWLMGTLIGVGITVLLRGHS